MAPVVVPPGLVGVGWGQLMWWRRWAAWMRRGTATTVVAVVMVLVMTILSDDVLGAFPL